MVLKHPGLKNGPFVPHNLISVQGSPVSLPKFQMAPRLKLFNVFWVKENGAQIYMSEGSQSCTHSECGLRFHPLLHTSYIRVCC